VTVVTWPESFTDHPAPYSAVIIEAIDRLLPTRGTYLDPMCGTGRCFDLETSTRHILGTEIEPEFAALHPRTICADATALPFATASLTGGFCSPAYPNRMAGDYTAAGWTRNPKGRRNYSLSKRWLARDPGVVLHRNNTARYSVRRDVDRYWTLHASIWSEMARVVRVGGTFILNTKDLPADLVTGKHVALLVEAGFVAVDHHRVHPPGYRNGAHRELRVEHEDVVVLVKVR
jgi:hypothetical protein